MPIRNDPDPGAIGGVSPKVESSGAQSVALYGTSASGGDTAIEATSDGSLVTVESINSQNLIYQREIITLLKISNMYLSFIADRIITPEDLEYNNE